MRVNPPPTESPGDRLALGVILRLAADRAAVAVQAMAAMADRVALESLRRSLVPAALPLVTGAEMAARYVPGRRAAGGDWYDVFTLPSGSCTS
jgi:phosphoserine phosphatase RsbU/P